MLFLVGLGNPGPRYAGHRHNIGFMVVDEIARRYGFSAWRQRFQGLTAEGSIAGQKLLALKPQTFMNESGRSAGEALRFFKEEPSQLIAFHDELDLAPGKLRVKRGGGAGGHNGLRSLDAHLGPDYRRVRLGIGHPGRKELVHGYVLQDFAKSEMEARDRLIDAVVSELPRLLEGDEASFMSRVAYLTAPEPAPAKPSPKPAAPDAGESS